MFTPTQRPHSIVPYADLVHTLPLRRIAQKSHYRLVHCTIALQPHSNWEVQLPHLTTNCSNKITCAFHPFFFVTNDLHDLATNKLLHWSCQITIQLLLCHFCKVHTVRWWGLQSIIVHSIIIHQTLRCLVDFFIFIDPLYPKRMRDILILL